MGFGIEQEHLIRNLELLRKKQCAYHGDRCDCKYLHNDTDEFHYLNETNGCPELRLAMNLLNELSKDEYSKLCVKARITIW